MKLTVLLAAFVTSSAASVALVASWTFELAVSKSAASSECLATVTATLVVLTAAFATGPRIHSLGLGYDQC